MDGLSQIQSASSFKLKDCLMNKFCCVVGLFFCPIQFLVILFVALVCQQDCGSHVDQLSRLMENFL